MLEVTGLTAAYGSAAVLKGVELRVEEGETVALVGPNGAGKTTLLRALSGQCRVLSGEILFQGRTLRAIRTEDIARLGLAVVPEGGGVFGGLTVAENLSLARCVTGKAADVKEVLDMFPVLAAAYRTSAAALSGGERQQLAIARALVSRPKLLALDEPSLGLSPQLVDKVFSLLASLRNSGITVLLVEQNARRAIQAADRSYVLVSGQVVAAGNKGDLLADAALARAYLDPAAARTGGSQP